LESDFVIFSFSPRMAMAFLEVDFLDFDKMLMEAKMVFLDHVY
jgi:hypothetical protein